MWAALSPLVLWLAAIAAYAYEDGMNLFQWMGRFSQVLERPFSIGWTPYTLKCMLGSLLLYGCGVALYYSSRENRRPGEEYGSAKWGNPKELNRKYMDHQHKDANIILTQRVRLGMDGYITQRNMNVLVVGGSGSGKTRFFCKPNIYSANCSYLITDPKGELLRAAGALLAAQGYEVRVFNLIDPSQSDGYNPFSYIHSEKDVLTLIDNLIKNTTPRNASSNDPFWEKAEIALDSALMLYLVSEAPPEEQNFEMLIYMMNFAEVREEDEQYRSPLDMLFRALEEEQPAHVAVKQYKVFKQAAGATWKTILNGKTLGYKVLNADGTHQWYAPNDVKGSQLNNVIINSLPITTKTLNLKVDGKNLTGNSPKVERGTTVQLCASCNTKGADVYIYTGEIAGNNVPTYSQKKATYQKIGTNWYYVVDLPCNTIGKYSVYFTATKDGYTVQSSERKLTVTKADPGVKGDTATNVTKPATVETGAEIKVPLFINEGEKIQIDTRTGEYLGRVKG